MGGTPETQQINYGVFQNNPVATSNATAQALFLPDETVVASNSTALGAMTQIASASKNRWLRSNDMQKQGWLSCF